MAYINNTIWRRIFSKPYENFEILIGDVKYTYTDLLLKISRKNHVFLTFFNTKKQIQNYWRLVIRRYCPCTRFQNLYRTNPHAKNFLRIEPNFLQFIMPYFFVYCQYYRRLHLGNFYLGKYLFLWYDYLFNSQLPYDNQYNKSILCVLI